MEISGNRLIIIITHLNVTLYALCFWIQIGTLPYLTRKFDVNPITFGYLQTTFSAVQLMGGPIFGRFGDLFGSKYASLLAYSASFLSYFLLGSATSIPMLFISRLPSACMHAMQAAQMVITDLSDSKSRSAELGKLGLSYGVGMVLGPVIGGLTVKFSNEQAAAFLAAFGSLLSIVLVVIFIPANTKILGPVSKTSDSDEKINDKKDDRRTKSGLFDMKEIYRIGSTNPIARSLLVIKTISGIPIGVLHSMFSILALNHFGLSAEMNGYVLSYVGLMSIISQGILVGQLSSLGLPEWSLIKWSLLVLALSYALIMVIVSDIITFCIALLPMVVSGAVFTTISSGMLTKSVQQKDTGTMLGISMAVHSLIRSVAPTIGGILLEGWGFSAFGVIGILFNFPLFLYLQMK